MRIRIRSNSEDRSIRALSPENRTIATAVYPKLTSRATLIVCKYSIKISTSFLMTSIILFDIDGTIVSENNPFVTYKDAESVIPKLYKLGYRLGLYSQGIPVIQLSKILITGLRKYFASDLLFISGNKFEMLSHRIDAISSPVYVVDNDESQILKLATLVKSNNVKVFHIDRLKSISQQSISSLEELPSYLTT